MDAGLERSVTVAEQHVEAVVPERVDAEVEFAVAVEVHGAHVVRVPEGDGRTGGVREAAGAVAEEDGDLP